MHQEFSGKQKEEIGSIRTEVHLNFMAHRMVSVSVSSPYQYLSICVIAGLVYAIIKTGKMETHVMN